ncbi:Leucine-rich repeat, immunoglobulin-like domain and transmembrane domain-containing protein 1, partial [Cichlidogyrus casuarinus]
YLNLSGCRINCLPNSLRGAKSLTELDLSRNYFQRIPQSLEDMALSLVHLDLSDNDLSSECLAEEGPELGNLLPNLLWLAMIKEMDESVFVDNFHALHTFSCRGNELIKLPDSLCSISSLKNLDLGDNRLLNLPNKFYRLKSITSANSYQGLQRAGLWLIGNPLTAIKKNIWQKGTTHSLFKFLQTREMRTLKNFQPLKIILVGHKSAGKTALLNRMSLGQVSNHFSLDDPTKKFDENILVEDDEDVSSFSASYSSNLPYAFCHCQSPNDLSYTFLELPDDDSFDFVQCHLLDNKAMILIVADCGKVLHATKQEFQEQILGKYLSLISAYSPEATVRLVLTCVDLLPELDGIPRNVIWNSQEVEGGNLSSSDEDADSSVEKSQVLRKVLDKIRFFVTDAQQLGLNIMPHVTFLGQRRVGSELNKSQPTRNINKFWFDIERLTLKEPIFTKRHYYASQHWTRFRLGLLKLYPEAIVLHLDLLRSENNPTLKTLQYIPKDAELEDCLEHWNSVGISLWWPRHPYMKNYVVLRPCKLSSILGRIANLRQLFDVSLFSVVADPEARSKSKFLRAVTKVGIQSIKSCLMAYNKNFEIAFATLRYLLPQETRGSAGYQPLESCPLPPPRPATVLGTEKNDRRPAIKTETEILKYVSVTSTPIEAYHHLSLLVKLFQCGISIRDRNSLVVLPANRGEEHNVTLASCLVIFPVDFTQFLTTFIIDTFEIDTRQRLTVSNCVMQYQREPQKYYERVFASLANEISSNRHRPIIVSKEHKIGCNLTFSNVGRELNIETKTSKTHLTELHLSSPFRFNLLLQVEFSKKILFRTSASNPEVESVIPLDPVSTFMGLSRDILCEITGNEMMNNVHPIRILDDKQ